MSQRQGAGDLRERAGQEILSGRLDQSIRQGASLRHDLRTFGRHVSGSGFSSPGFPRTTLGGGPAGEVKVRSMMAVVAGRSRLKPLARDLGQIRSLAESCARQLTAWTQSIDGSPMPRKRYLTPQSAERRR